MKSCEGKKTFSSYALANQVAGRDHDLTRCVFYCQQCHGFHLGTKAPKVAYVNRKKQRIKELTEAEIWEYESRN